MKAIAFLSLPAVIGIAAWLAVWAPYFTPIRYTHFPAQFATGLAIAFTLMLWIGAITSPFALVLTSKRTPPRPQRIASFALNGIWTAISWTLSAAFLLHLFSQKVASTPF